MPYRFLLLVFAGLLFLPAHAQETRGADGAPQLAAKAWVLIDYASGRVLAGKDADSRLEPASLTKVMTTYLIAAALRDRQLAPDQKVRISERAWRTPGSRSFLQVGTQIDVDTLLKGMIVQSGNDAAVALAEAAAGSEEAFAARMNAMATQLGLRDTHFLNASGFFDKADARHYSTPRDLARLAAALLRDHPEVHALHALKEFTHDGIRQQNRNRLLWLDASVDGLKTGHSSTAGYCLIGTAQRGAQRLIAVVLGAESDAARSAETLRLLNWGYQAFDLLQLYGQGETLVAAPVFKGAQATVAAGLEQPLRMPVAKNRRSDPTVRVSLLPAPVAPLRRGTRLGTLTVVQDNLTLGEYPLVALHDLDQGNIVRRLWDGARLWFAR